MREKALSSIARWTYINTATVRPFLGINNWGGEVTYGEEYSIACTWSAESEIQSGMGGQSGSQGEEFVSRHIIYTEDRRPKRLDLIKFDGSDGWEEIRDRTEWDMSPFGDTPDVKLVT